MSACKSFIAEESREQLYLCVVILEGDGHNIRSPLIYVIVKEGDAANGFYLGYNMEDLYQWHEKVELENGRHVQFFTSPLTESQKEQIQADLDKAMKELHGRRDRNCYRYEIESGKISYFDALQSAGFMVPRSERDTFFDFLAETYFKNKQITEGDQQGYRFYLFESRPKHVN